MNQFNASMQAPLAMNQKRYGCFVARIGTDHFHKFRVPFSTRFRNGEATGQTVAPGIKLYSIVEDITRHPEVKDHVMWYCAYCRQEWKSKEELLAAHPDNKVLVKQQEAHLYYAVAEVPGVPGQHAKHDDKGKVTSPAVPEKPPIAMLLSDEE